MITKKEIVLPFAAAAKGAGLDVWLSPDQEWGIFFDPQSGGIDTPQPFIGFHVRFSALEFGGNYEAASRQSLRHVGSGWGMDPPKDWTPESLKEMLRRLPPSWATNNGKYPVRWTKPSRSIHLGGTKPNYMSKF